MPTRHDLYGFKTAQIDEARLIVEAAIGASLEARDSSYYAGDYFRLRLGTGRGVRLYKNRDPSTDGFVRSNYSEYALLLEIDDVPDMDSISERLASSAMSPDLLSSRLLSDGDDD